MPALRSYWNAGVGRTKPNPVAEALGTLMLAGMAAFSFYNLYTCVRFGLVYRMARRQRDGWIAYAADPTAFVFWTGIYSLPILLPVLFAALLACGHVSEQKRARRAALRQFTDGGGPPPLIRRLDER
jgi:hypothetical protein